MNRPEADKLPEILKALQSGASHQTPLQLPLQQTVYIGSNDHLLQPNPVESPHLVYMQLEAVRQTQALPPANDDPVHVQYAQIEHQDVIIHHVEDNILERTPIRQ